MCHVLAKLLFALTDMSTFLGKKILVEPFICQSKTKGVNNPLHLHHPDRMPSQPRLAMHRWAADEPCRMCVDVGSFEHVSTQGDKQMSHRRAAGALCRQSVLRGVQSTGSSSRWDIPCHKYCVNCTGCNDTCLLLLRF
ncbi:Hypothetical predicted protein [Xyrichtys novacula]|uniref:Secreted protein n=1 Tax=Xyrichtys novacula TaxID=13765 RepID=A0AAV1F781_XYRNO|nr:Hypothetical predicted protein [Xyrichtys novacula]